MDELAKTELRNYAMAAGFFGIALWVLICGLLTLFAKIGIPVSIENTATGSIIIGILIILSGIILIILKKRDLSAITFIMVGAMTIFAVIDPYSNYTYLGSVLFMRILMGVFFLILAVVILTAKDRKKYLLFILPALFGIYQILIGIVNNYESRMFFLQYYLSFQFTLPQLLHLRESDFRVLILSEPTLRLISKYPARFSAICSSDFQQPHTHYITSQTVQ